MNSNTILVLGDSTSMSIGLEKKTYPFLLAEAAVWPDNTKIQNCSLPGFTSADAAAFFFRHHGARPENLKAVIIYLGNCDTTSTEVRKGRHGRLQQWMNNCREMIGKMPAKTRLKNRLLHLEWSNSYNPLIESPEDPADFEFNIGRILKSCSRARVPAILVYPKANLYFLPGIGKGNFVFYRHIGINEKLSSLCSFPDVRFKKAMSQHETGKFDEAADIYKEILSTQSPVPMNQEYPLLVLNNYAAARAEAGKHEEAIYLFNLLLKEQSARKEIVLYNLAQIYKSLSNMGEYSRFLMESYESDDSLYRIRSPYVNALKRLAQRYSSVKTVDMAATVPDELYLDHCHPLPAGQVKMADEMQAKLAESGIDGDKAAEIESILYNPELARGNTSEFHDYFKTYSSLSETQIATAMTELEKLADGKEDLDLASSLFSSIPRDVLTATEYYLRHPCFTRLSDIFHSPPRYPSDVGRFPEYFIVRHMIPYLRAHESDQELASRFKADLNLLRSSDQLQSILPARTIQLVDIDLPQIDIAYEQVRLPQILAKVRKLLKQHLQAGNQVYKRLKTTIFWYVRETLRFGAHSRVSMLYERVLLEFLAEGLAVAGVLDIEMGAANSAEIEALASGLQTAVQIHEDFCSRFSITEDTDQLLLDYDQHLLDLAVSLETNETEKVCIS